MPVRNPRAVPPGEIQAAFSLVAPEVETHAAPDLEDAFRRARQHPEVILVAGSFFLVGEALARLTGQDPPEVSWQ